MKSPSSPQDPWSSAGRLAVLGTGYALPGDPVSTEQLTNRLAESCGLARQREGQAIARRMAIRTRHFCRGFEAPEETARAGQSNPELVAAAVRSALQDAGLHIDDVGYLIAHTTTPQQPLPANVALAADHLGYRGPHVELRQACTGFANALMIAFGLLSTPRARPVVLVGSETGSLFCDPRRAATDSEQLVNLMQMGDGAGAIVLGPADSGRCKIGPAWFGSIGLGRAPGIQLRHGQCEFAHDYAAILQSGSALFDAGATAARGLGLELESHDTIIPHQVSGRVGAQLARHFGLDASRAFTNADRIGNTGSAAIWIALAEVRSRGLAAGATVLTLGAEATKYMYGGFSYAHA